MFKILLVEDDHHLRILLSKHLEKEGFCVTPCLDGSDALQFFEKEKFDLLLTDIMMPNLCGNELIKKIRNIKKDMPIIMLTALDSITDKRKSFDYGADDYLTKPIDFEELIMRIYALLRRYNQVNSKIIKHKNITLDYDKLSVVSNNNDLLFSIKEFLILYKLISSPGRIYSREDILNDIWGTDSLSIDRTVDVHINRIREKLNNESIEIQAVRGLGYKLVLK